MKQPLPPSILYCEHIQEEGTNSCLQCNAVHCISVHFCAVQCSAVQCSAVQCSAV